MTDDKAARRRKRQAAERARAYRARKAGKAEPAEPTPLFPLGGMEAIDGDTGDHVFDLDVLPETIRHERAMQRVELEERRRADESGIPSWAATPDPDADRVRAARLKRQILAQAAGREPEPTPQSTYNGRIVDSPEWQRLTLAEKLAKYGRAR